MDDDWKSIITLLPMFGTHGKLVFEYVEKFGIKPLATKSSKVLRLLRQMGKLFETESFEWRKCNKSLSKSGIVEALEIVVNKNFDVPLENHNYLKKVMVGISEREGKEKSVRAEREMRKREKLSLRGVGPSKPEAVNRSPLSEKEKEEPMSTGEFKERIRQLAGQMKGIED